ncbi:nuclease-related domain-containing protein [Kiritimatiellota bacterium B12222]|nr:nuclease-related domain-containing protein [Kiritimatiellota bacterium B12222]
MKKIKIPKPAEPKPIRQAGESLREQMDKILIDGVMIWYIQILILVVGASMTWYLVFFPEKTKSTAIIYTIMAIGLCFVNTRKFFKARKHFGNLKKGLLGERLVEEQLNDIRKAGFDVFHDLILKDEHGTENIDHIIVGPSGVFTLETKNWTSKGVPQDDLITYDGESLRIGNYVQDIKFLKQPRRQAGKLQALLQPEMRNRLWVVPILCFRGRSIRLTRFNPNGLQVVNETDIGTFVLSKANQLDPKDIKKIVAELKELNRKED